MNPILALALTASISLPSPPEISSTATNRPTLASQVAALAAAGPSRPDTAARAARIQPGGDSLKNGAIVGGVIAAAAGGGFLYYLCRALDDTGGNQKCAGPALIAAGVAGLGGAALGAGIDAMFARAPSLRMRVRF